MEENPGYNKILLISTLFISIFTETAAHAKSCGSVSIVSGDSCSTLKVKFDLAGCGDASYERETKIDCQDKTASVLLRTDLYRYTSELVSSVGKSGTMMWEVVGQMVQSDLAHAAGSNTPGHTTKSMEKAEAHARPEATHKLEKPVKIEHRIESAVEKAPHEPKEEAKQEAKQEGEGGRSIASLGLANPNPYSTKEAPGPGIVFTLMFDGYYALSLTQPQPVNSATHTYMATPNINVRAYDFYHNNIGFNVAELTIKKTGPEISFTADLDFGPQADYNAAVLGAATPGGPSISAIDEVSKNLGQIFLTYTPKWAPDLTLDFGKMATHLGYEGWKAKDNWQYSRSTIFLYGIPLWHTGLHAGYAVLPKKLSLNAYLYNSWNSIYENNASKTWGGEVKFTPSESFTLVYNYIAGPEQQGNDSNIRWVHEANFALTLSPLVSLALETVYGHENGVTNSNNSIVNTDWIGAYFAGKVSPTAKWYISPRFEVYRDTTGANLGGDPQTLYGFTLTNSYKPTEGLETRLELRADASTYGQRFSTATGVSNSQSTVTLGVIYSME